MESTPRELVPLNPIATEQNRPSMPAPPDYPDTAQVIREPDVNTQSRLLHKDKMKKIQTWITLALLIMTMFGIFFGPSLKKDEKDSTNKMETLSTALYKIMQMLNNNPQLLAIQGVDGSVQKQNDFASFDFQPFRRPNITASG